MHEEASWIVFGVYENDQRSGYLAEKVNKNSHKRVHALQNRRAKEEAQKQDWSSVTKTILVRGEKNPFYLKTAVIEVR